MLRNIPVSFSLYIKFSHIHWPCRNDRRFKIQWNTLFISHFYLPCLSLRMHAHAPQTQEDTVSFVACNLDLMQHKAHQGSRVELVLTSECLPDGFFYQESYIVYFLGTRLLPLNVYVYSFKCIWQANINRCGLITG